jgi:hypothetical protein
MADDVADVECNAVHAARDGGPGEKVAGVEKRDP